MARNSSIPEPTLTMKHYLISNHRLYESVSSEILRFGKEYGQTNIADILTKVISGYKRWYLWYIIMWQIIILKE